MTRFIIFGLSLLGQAPFARAHQCDLPLTKVKTLELPRELKLSSEAMAYLTQNESHRALLQSLSNIFGLIYSSDYALSELAVSLGEPTEVKAEATDLLNTNFFRRRPELVDDAVVASYSVLKESTAQAKLPAEDLSILAFLTKTVPKNSGTVEALLGRVDWKLAQRQNREFTERIKFLVSKAKYRSALQAILATPGGRLQFMRIWNSIMRELRAPLVEEKDIVDLSDRLSRGPLQSSYIVYLVSYLTTFVFEVSKYGTKQGLHPADVMVAIEGIRVLRSGFLQSVAPYFAEELQVKTSLGAITEVLDYFLFGTLPPEPNKVFQLMVEQAKILLLPLKGEYARAKASAPLSPTPARAIEPFQLNLIDHFAPVGSLPTPKVRSQPDAEATIAPEAIENQIPKEYALREFTSYASNPLPLSKLKANQEYQFWFMREDPDRLTVQSVKFGESALNWFSKNELMARELLNALHLGRARLEKQSGIKCLKGKSSRYDGTIYELKTTSYDRGILLQVNGTWQLVTVVKKANLDRTVEFVAPL